MRTEPIESGWTPPESFEEYRLVRLLGRGAMGRVYLAHDLLLDRQVAIKFVARQELSPGAREQFFREARAVAARPLNAFIESTGAGCPSIRTVDGSFTDPDTEREPPGAWVSSRFRLSYVATATASSICSDMRFPAGSWTFA